jgi:hypothetical protein
MVTCGHCGQQHPDDAKFCSTTGKAMPPRVTVPGRPAVPPPPATMPPPPPTMPPPATTEQVRPLGEQKGVFDLLREAMELYRANARVFLITAAVLFVPGSFISSCALSAVLAPAMVSVPAAEEAAEQLAQRSEELSKRMRERAARAPNDPRSAEEYQRDMRELGREAGKLGGMAIGGFSVMLLGLAGWAITALILYGAVLPLTQGALTIAVADRVVGGHAQWREHWGLVLRRFGLLLSTGIPMLLLVIAGYFLFVLPGIILSFVFVFAIPVVLIEGIGGTAALKRSYELVKSDWLRTAIMLIVFGILSAVAHRVAALFVPRGALFFGNFLGDLLFLVIMPVPIIGSVLLYFDLRRKLDGFTEDTLKTELEALRPVP